MTMIHNKLPPISSLLPPWLRSGKVRTELEPSVEGLGETCSAAEHVEKPEPLRVLMLEDRLSDADRMLHELRRAGFCPTWERVQTRDAFLAHLTPDLDVILADYNLPCLDGLSALSLVQESGLEIPFLIVSGSISEEIAVTCMRKGAADYLLKDRMTRLGPAVRGALEQKRLRLEKHRAEEQTRASLREKEVLLREIHHRVKNNLQIISSLLRLQAGYVRDNQARALFRESQHRVKSMALVHETLYQSRDLGKIDMAMYIRRLATHLERSYALALSPLVAPPAAPPSASRVGEEERQIYETAMGEARSEGVNLNLNVQDVFLGIDTAVPCALMIHELISNALKHAFPAARGGQVQVDFHSTEDRKLVLVVSDNGIGLPETVDIRHSKSLGLQLVTALTDQLGATVEVARKNGTTFIITFTELK